MKKLSTTQFAILMFVVGFLVTAVFCAYVLAPDTLTIGEFRKATLQEKYFWFSALVIAFISTVVRCEPWNNRY
jgi:hypothetical protein